MRHGNHLADAFLRAQDASSPCHEVIVLAALEFPEGMRPPVRFPVTERRPGRVMRTAEILMGFFRPLVVEVDGAVAGGEVAFEHGNLLGQPSWITPVIVIPVCDYVARRQFTAQISLRPDGPLAGVANKPDARLIRRVPCEVFPGAVLEDQEFLPAPRLAQEAPDRRRQVIRPLAQRWAYTSDERIPGRPRASGVERE